MTTSRAIAWTILAVAVGAFFAFGLHHSLAFDNLLAHRAQLTAFQQEHPVQMAATYFLVYVGVTALSLPGAAVLTLAGGAIFDFGTAVLLASFASTTGATLAFLASRFLLADWVRHLAGARFAAIDAGMSRSGAFYLFALRLTPVFPFWLVNLTLGLTRMRPWTFYWVSQIGMLPGTAAFIYAGAQLARFQFSARLVLALTIVGLLPLAARKALSTLEARRVYGKWNAARPARYDYNMVVIGGGSAGLVSAYIASATKARVALIEQGRMGGDCLNTGCVPSKALLRSAKLLAQIARSREFGIAGAHAHVDFAEVMERVARVVGDVAPHDSVERYTALGVDIVEGRARITSPWSVSVQSATGVRTLTTRNIVIAAGARPFVPPIPGIQEIDYLTSDTIWGLRRRPDRLLVLGGGPIGAELAQAFARLGCQVTIVEMAQRLVAREDPDVSEAVRQQFEDEGIRVLTGHTAKRFVVENGEKLLVADHSEGEIRIGFDAVLVAVGRTANTTGYGLEELGIGTTPTRTVETNEYLQTIYPNIFACGDVAGPFQFTHTAAHQAWYASVNALFGTFRRFKTDYRVIPWATFTDPEFARVGLSEQDAIAAKTPHQVTKYPMAELDRAIADGETRGFVKVLTRPGTDTVIGATIVGAHAGELITEYVLAMKHGLGLNKILGTIHVYPTLAEANKYAAGAWKRRTVTRGQWALLSEFHAWMRGDSGLARVLWKVRDLVRDRQPAYEDREV